MIVVLQAGLSFTLSAALVAFLSLQRPLTLLHKLVLAVIASFLAWTAGLLLVTGGGESLAVFNTPITSWAGPFFWIHTFWSYAYTGGGDLSRVLPMSNNDRSGSTSGSRGSWGCLNSESLDANRGHSPSARLFIDCRAAVRWSRFRTCGRH